MKILSVNMSHLSTSFEDLPTAHPKPNFIRSEKLAPVNTVFDIDQQEINNIWDELDNIDPTS